MTPPPESQAPCARLPVAIAAALEDFARRVRDRFGSRLAKLVLFGSYARGDWRAESDIDVLVIVTDLTERERREVFELAEEVYWDRLLHVAPLAQSSEEYATIERREYRIAADIAREGIVL